MEISIIAIRNLDGGGERQGQDISIIAIRNLDGGGERRGQAIGTTARKSGSRDKHRPATSTLSPPVTWVAHVDAMNNDDAPPPPQAKWREEARRRA